MKKLIWLLLFSVPQAVASTYTAIWCPINWSGFSGGWYEVCIENTAPNGECTKQLQLVWWGSTSYTFDLPLYSTAWIRVRAVANARTIVGSYSNPVQIVSGLTPPAVGGCS